MQQPMIVGKVAPVAMRRLQRGLAVLAAASLALTACSANTQQPKVTSNAPTDKVLRLSFLQDPGQPPDPDVYYAGQGLILTQNLYEGLLQYKLGVDKPEIVGDLATKWTVSADDTTFTLDLRPGVTFHDGTPFTSAAVKPSFDRRLAVNQGPAYMVSDIASVSTPSPLQVVIKLKSPNSAFLDYLASPYGPKMMSPTILKAQAGKDHAQTYLQTHDAGTGAYTLTKAAVGQAYQMKAYPGWWGPKVYFQTVELPVISDLSTQQLLLDKGQLHMILHDLNAPAVKAYLGNPAVKTYSMPSFTTEQVYVNPHVGLFKDKAARVAFQQAMDVDTLASQVFAGRSEKATGNYPQGMLPPGMDHQVIVPDTAPMKAIAAKAPAADKKIVLGYDTSQPDDQQLANLVGAKLQSLGLTPTVQGYTTSQVFGWIGNQKGAPSVLFSSFWPDAANPYTAAHILYDPGAGLNYMGCSDPTVTKLLSGVLKTGDPATYAKIGELATATGCWTNLAYRKDFMVGQTWLKGVEQSHDLSAPMSLRIAGLSA